MNEAVSRRKMFTKFFTGLALCCILLSLWLVFEQNHLPTVLGHKIIDPLNSISNATREGESANVISHVRNETLGFEKVFVINLKERGDKLDAITLAASLTGITLDVMEGARGEDVSNKSIPAHDGPDAKWKGAAFLGTAGCWRSHMNFIRKMVADNIHSALVVEDDADWSVYLKDQLEHVAAGTQYITNSTSTTSPYGNDWDMLWLGHCGSSFSKKERTRRYVIENDPTVVAPNHYNLHYHPNMKAAGYSDSSRVVYRPGIVTCTQGYALSLRGARKMLQHYTTVQNFLPIDWEHNAVCTRKILDFQCLAVHPPMWGHHRSAGFENRNSDITDKKGDFRKKAETLNIAHSVRLNGANILVKGLDAITSQYDDMPELYGDLKARKD